MSSTLEEVLNIPCQKPKADLYCSCEDRMMLIGCVEVRAPVADQAVSVYAASTRRHRCTKHIIFEPLILQMYYDH